MLRGRGFVERANYITGSALTGNGLTAFSKEFPTGEGWFDIQELSFPDLSPVKAKKEKE